MPGGEIIVIDSDSESEVVVRDVKGKAKGKEAAVTAPFTSAREQLEKERLERQRKRQRDQGIESDEERASGTGYRLRDGKRVAVEDDFIVKSRIAPPGHPFAGANVQTLVPVTATTDPIYTRIKSGDRFWTGSIKHSENEFASDAQKGIPFADLILPATGSHAAGLKQVIITSFCADFGWLFPHFPVGVPQSAGGTAPDILYISDAGKSSTHSRKKGLSAGVHELSSQLPNWHMLVPEKAAHENAGVQHIKFLLLVYQDHLRFVLSTGNMIGCDWSYIENTAYIHDFPLKAAPAPAARKPEHPSDFEAQMLLLLKELDVTSGHPIYKDLAKFDLSWCDARLVLSVPTIGAPLTAWTKIEEAGLGRLSKIIRDFKMKPIRGGHVLEMQGSSTGAYKQRWLQTIHLIASGHDARTCLPFTGSAAAATKKYKATLSIPAQLPADTHADYMWPANVKVLFPSERYVTTVCATGVGSGGTFYGKSDAFKENNYKHMFHIPESKRATTLMHAKNLLSLPPNALADPESVKAEPDQIIGWSYMGSANATQAAWGYISGTGVKPSASISNFELGVVFPIRRRDLDTYKSPELRCFGLRVLMHKHPLTPYSPTDVPWDQFKYAGSSSSS